MFKSIFYPNIRRHNNNYQNIKLEKIVVIPMDENVNKNINININKFYQKRKLNSPYNNNEKEYSPQICDNV
jgi:hypothetical protein